MLADTVSVRVKSTNQKVKKSIPKTVGKKKVSGRPRYPEALVQRNVKLTERQISWLLAGGKNVSDRLRVLLDWVMKYDPDFYSTYPGVATMIKTKQVNQVNQ